MKKTQILCECAVMIAMSIAFSFIKLIRMPLGGSVTFVSMLPVMICAVRHGVKWGLASSGIFAAYQLVQSIASGNVFPYCYTTATLMICILFDYLIPFGALGFAGFAHGKTKGKVICLCAALIILRFACHFVTGVFVWGQWADGMSVYLYSLLYNGQYMLPELILTLAVLTALITARPVEKMILNK